MTTHPRILRPAGVALCVAALSLVAGCGSSPKTTAGGDVSASAAASDAASAPAASGTTETSPAAPAAGSKDPCSLLTAAEVSAATGGTVSDGKSETSPGPLGGKKCNWTNDGAPVIDFQVILQTNADITISGQTVDTLFDETTSTIPGLTAVSGIGTKAFFGKTMGYVRTGNYLVTTDADLGGTADSSSINKALTTMAIAKL